MLEKRKVFAALQQIESIAGEGNPVAVCIVNENGNVLGYMQMDNMGSRSFSMAFAKAYTAAKMGQTTAKFHERLIKEQLTLADFGDPSFTSIQGGVPVKQENTLLGAVAVAGRKPEEDEKLAMVFAKILLSA